MGKRTFLKLFAWSLLVISMTHAAHSDSPPAVPKDIKVFSSNRRFYAFSALKAAKTSIFSAQDRQKTLWEIPGYHPVLFLSDDGQHLMTGYSGGSIFSETVKASDTFLCFYTSGKLVREVHVSDVFPNLDEIPQSASGRVWGNYFGFNRQNRFILLLFDGKRLTFDAGTGRPMDH